MEKAVYLIPGMTVKIALVVETEVGSKGAGAFITQNTSKNYQGKTYNLTNGFAIHDDTVGSLESVESEPAVLYTHHKPEKNTIYFWSFEGNMESISIIGVPIHDHSSIVQGGPAFGSFFTDDEVV